MSVNIEFLTLEDVIEIHKILIDKSPLSDESDSILDMNLLDSAISQPKQTFFGELLNPTIYDQAAAYLFSLSKNHAFENGNKRTALAVTIAFLRINGYRITLSQDAVEKLILDVVTGKKTKDEIADIFRNSAVKPMT